MLSNLLLPNLTSFSICISNLNNQKLSYKRLSRLDYSFTWNFKVLLYLFNIGKNKYLQLISTDSKDSFFSIDIIKDFKD
jgi:hypothetical protein